MDITNRCIAQLVNQGIDQWDSIYPSEKDFQSDILGQTLYVMLIEDRICGCICINKLECPGYETAAWQGQQFIVIHKLMVDPQNQKLGIGRFAMHYAEKLAQSEKMDSVRLDCFTENPQANRFYRQLGYTVRGQTRFRKGIFNLYEKMIDGT